MTDIKDEEAKRIHMQKALKRKERRMEKLREEEAARDKEARLQLRMDEHFMKLALRQAKKAYAIGEVPIGCVIVRDGKVLARGYNRRNADRSALSHAEITAIRQACRKLHDWRLTDCTLYVTLEPCPMCAGCCVQSRVGRVVIGAMSPKSGCGGTLLNILQNDTFNHQVEVASGVLTEDCSSLLTSFFGEMRKK